MSANSSETVTKILFNLGIIAKITPGQTLSPSSMTLVDHNTWSTSLWRTYAGENRKATIAYIKNIFVEAFSIYEMTHVPDILIQLRLAIIGFTNLKETYRGDYYTIGEINLILQWVEETFKKIGRTPAPQPEVISPVHFHSEILTEIKESIVESVDPVVESVIESVDPVVEYIIEANIEPVVESVVEPTVENPISYESMEPMQSVISEDIIQYEPLIETPAESMMESELETIFEPLIDDSESESEASTTDTDFEDFSEELKANEEEEDEEPETRFEIPFELLPEIMMDSLNETNYQPPNPNFYPEIIIETEGESSIESSVEIPIEMAFQLPPVSDSDTTDPLQSPSPISIFNTASQQQESSRAFRSFSDSSYLWTSQQEDDQNQYIKKTGDIGQSRQSVSYPTLDPEPDGTFSSSPDCLCGGCYPGWICPPISGFGTPVQPNIVYTETWSVSTHDIEAQEYTLFGRTTTTNSNEFRYADPKDHRGFKELNYKSKGFSHESKGFSPSKVLPQISTVPPIIRIAQAFIRWLESGNSDSEEAEYDAYGSKHDSEESEHDAYESKHDAYGSEPEFEIPFSY